MAYKEGQWVRPWFLHGPDSTLHGVRHNARAKYANIDRISLGTVFLPQPEPLYKQTSVSLNLVTGGLLTNVAWPGAQVNANVTGVIPGGVALGIHGLWESPLPGQQVLVGYVDGSQGNPIIINKYPYNSMQRPDLEIMHFLPMTLKAIGPTDVVLGHHTGSFIALRGTLPLPAQIDIFSFTALTLTAVALMTLTCTSAMTITAASITMTSAAPLTIFAVPGVIINAGTRPVAAMGDLTTTLLGPSPIVATGVTCLVV